MDQPIQRTRTLSQVRIVRIIGTDPIEDQIEAVRKVGNACPKTVEIESIFDVGPFYLAEHFVAFEAAEPDG